MNYAIDHCEPFDGKCENIWMKAEHVGRYLFAVDCLSAFGCKKVVDVACAEGFGSEMLCESGFDVYGADVSNEYLAHAKARCNGTFVRCDLEKENLPKSFGSADGAVCFETIEHLDCPNNLLRNLYDCLCDNGVLILSFPNYIFEKLDADGVNYDPYHKRIYTPNEMRGLIESAGFVLQDEYGQSICNDLYAKEHSAVKVGKISQSEVDRLFLYDKKSVLDIARVIGYPDRTRVEDSYSHVWVLKKHH